MSTHDEMVDALGFVTGRQLDERSSCVKKMELGSVLSGEPLGGAAKLSETGGPILVEADDDSAHRHPL
jgi:hypothetical protein